MTAELRRDPAWRERTLAKYPLGASASPRRSPPRSSTSPATRRPGSRASRSLSTAATRRLIRRSRACRGGRGSPPCRGRGWRGPRRCVHPVGGGADHGAGGVGQLDPDAELPDRAVLGMLDFHDHLPVGDLGVADDFPNVVDLADADVRPDEPVEPLVAVARPDDRLDLGRRGFLLGVGGRTNWSGWRAKRRARGGRWPGRSSPRATAPCKPIVRSLPSRVS